MKSVRTDLLVLAIVTAAAVAIGIWSRMSILGVWFTMAHHTDALPGDLLRPLGWDETQ